MECDHYKSLRIASFDYVPGPEASAEKQSAVSLMYKLRPYMNIDKRPGSRPSPWSASEGYAKRRSRAPVKTVVLTGSEKGSIETRALGHCQTAQASHPVPCRRASPLLRTGKFGLPEILQVMNHFVDQLTRCSEMDRSVVSVPPQQCLTYVHNQAQNGLASQPATKTSPNILLGPIDHVRLSRRSIGAMSFTLLAG
jgi:hypothetical protein